MRYGLADLDDADLRTLTTVIGTLRRAVGDFDEAD
jgi:hypothetical protein